MSYNYALTPSNLVIQRSDGTTIPVDQSNSDYQAYLAWVAAGNTATPVPLSYYRTQQTAAISAACSSAIQAGLPSSALGAAFTYPSTVLDQQNTIAAATASMVPGLASSWVVPLWCKNAEGVWSYINHTAAQVQQVGQDLMNAIVAMKVQNATLAAQVAAATTQAAVQAVVWSNPA